MSQFRDLVRRIAPNTGIALVAVVIFHLLSVSSGRIDVNQGRGWDGRAVCADDDAGWNAEAADA